MILNELCVMLMKNLLKECVSKNLGYAGNCFFNVFLSDNIEIMTKTGQDIRASKIHFHIYPTVKTYINLNYVIYSVLLSPTELLDKVKVAFLL